MHLNNDGTSLLVSSNKWSIVKADIRRLRARKFFISHLLYLIICFSRAELRIGDILFIKKCVDHFSFEARANGLPRSGFADHLAK